MTSETEALAVDPIAANRDAMFQQCGRTVLWVGIEAQHWTPDQFAAAARFAASHGVDCICPKVADGSIKWYGTAAQLAAIRQRVLACGVGFIPFIYSYGPKLSDHQAHDEAEVVADMLSVCPIVQIDMEAEWNGQVSAAVAFAAELRPIPGEVSISTWGDPAEQNWLEVAKALAPAANGWTPQEYTNFLETRADAEYTPSIFTVIQPGVDLTQEFGANNQSGIIEDAISRGCKTFYLWEYQVALANPGLFNELVTLIHSKIAPPVR